MKKMKCPVEDCSEEFDVEAGEELVAVMKVPQEPHPAPLKGLHEHRIGLIRDYRSPRMLGQPS